MEPWTNNLNRYPTKQNQITARKTGERETLFYFKFLTHFLQLRKHKHFYEKSPRHIDNELHLASKSISFMQ